MAFSKSDLANVEQAIRDLVTGQRIVDVTIQGKQITYAQTKLPELKALRSNIAKEVGSIPHRVYAKNGGRSS